MSGRVLFYVQHLLGVGHLRRAALIAAAMDRAGLDVSLVCGGAVPPHMAAPNVRLVQLPPVRAGAGFSELVDAKGAPLDEAGRAARRDLLLAELAAVKPDALITETFPFGRRQMRFELLPLLDAAAAMSPKPLVCASIRDILQARQAKRVDESVDLARRHYDYVLTHGDSRLIALAASFPRADAIAGRTVYTGYVAPPHPPRHPPAAARQWGVVVSAGGGAVGAAMLRAALAARPRTRFADAPWLLLTGANLAAAEFRALQDAAPAGVTVERGRPDLAATLATARLSVSQAGYNTCMDLLAARTPAVLVPYAGASASETEQPMRADLFARRGWARVAPERALGVPGALADAIDAAADLTPEPAGVALDGAARTAAMVAHWIGAR